MAKKDMFSNWASGIGLKKQRASVGTDVYSGKLGKSKKQANVYNYKARDNSSLGYETRVYSAPNKAGHGTYIGSNIPSDGGKTTHYSGSYKKGGIVKKTGIAKVHKGERVLSVEQRKKVENMLKKKGLSKNYR